RSCSIMTAMIQRVSYSSPPGRPPGTQQLLVTGQAGHAGALTAVAFLQPLENFRGWSAFAHRRHRSREVPAHGAVAEGVVLVHVLALPDVHDDVGDRAARPRL